MDCRVLECNRCIITSSYGKRKIKGKENYHNGVDIVKEGYQLDYIIAHTSGIVCELVDGEINNRGSASYGNYVKIMHENGYYTLYAHMEKGICVRKYQSIKKGQKIGFMGDSGDAYGKHLHFEVWKNNYRIDPTEYLNKDLCLEKNSLKEEISKYKYHVGDFVYINGVYVSTTSNNKLVPKINRGKITKIIKNAPNPYLLDQGNIGWINDSCIIKKEETFLSNQKYEGTSIVDALKEINAESSYQYRCKLAKINNICNYNGSELQNKFLLDLLKKGKLKC